MQAVSIKLKTFSLPNTLSIHGTEPFPCLMQILTVISRQIIVQNYKGNSNKQNNQLAIDPETHTVMRSPDIKTWRVTLL